ncbi:hypothetical protein AGR4A_Cc170224 [Agrobacterium tumefaciens str. B6]|uniref:IstB-like ATP-binding domain-containing protein n=1 Tax=Agrobacterium tumefaciens str. B6 TaxID=1183423 RepID=A0A822UY98_AGRTU|nr:hypothetical protein AGR4A_Cc170224 [Agrobacterium tumefaciens str. B6]
MHASALQSGPGQAADRSCATRIAQWLRGLDRDRRSGMKNAQVIDEARLGIMLNELRLPTIKTLWQRFAEQADREGWPAARFLSAIAEHELAERAHRRIERHLAEAHLAARQDIGQLRFRCRAYGLQGTGHGNRRRRQLACQRSQYSHVRSARRRKEPSRRRYRPGPDRERMEGPVHPDHRSRAEAPGRPKGVAA